MHFADLFASTRPVQILVKIVQLCIVTQHNIMVRDTTDIDWHNNTLIPRCFLNVYEALKGFVCMLTWLQSQLSLKQAQMHWIKDMAMFI